VFLEWVTTGRSAVIPETFSGQMISIG